MSNIYKYQGQKRFFIENYATETPPPLDDAPHLSQQADESPLILKKADQEIQNEHRQMLRNDLNRSQYLHNDNEQNNKESRKKSLIKLYESADQQIQKGSTYKQGIVTGSYVSQQIFKGKYAKLGQNSDDDDLELLEKQSKWSFVSFFYTNNANTLSTCSIGFNQNTNDWMIEFNNNIEKNFLEHEVTIFSSIDFSSNKGDDNTEKKTVGLKAVKECANSKMVEELINDLFSSDQKNPSPNIKSLENLKNAMSKAHMSKAQEKVKLPQKKEVQRNDTSLQTIKVYSKREVDNNIREAKRKSISCCWASCFMMSSGIMTTGVSATAVYAGAALEASLLAGTPTAATLAFGLSFLMTVAGVLFAGAGAFFCMAAIAATYGKPRAGLGMAGLGGISLGVGILFLTASVCPPLGWIVMGLGALVAIGALFWKACSLKEGAKNSEKASRRKDSIVSVSVSESM